MTRVARVSDPRKARHRRETALARAELRGPSEPRVQSGGVTSFPVKAEDPVIRALIDSFRARQNGAEQ
jgi:hypothetical protein